MAMTISTQIATSRGVGVHSFGRSDRAGEVACRACERHARCRVQPWCVCVHAWCVCVCVVCVCVRACVRGVCACVCVRARAPAAGSLWPRPAHTQTRAGRPCAPP
eukprot:2471600-Pleurochrysis_carterae.AAC.1